MESVAQDATTAAEDRAEGKSGSALIGWLSVAVVLVLGVAYVLHDVLPTSIAMREFERAINIRHNTVPWSALESKLARIGVTPTPSGRATLNGRRYEIAPRRSDSRLLPAWNRLAIWQQRTRWPMLRAFPIYRGALVFVDTSGTVEFAMGY
jgi:hypothetical protein